MLSSASIVEETGRIFEQWVAGELAASLGPPHALSIKRNDQDSGADVIVRHGKDLQLVVECKLSSSAATVASAIQKAQAAASKVGRKSVPMVAVPFMGEIGKRLCAEANVSWLDLSGNAHIVAPGLAILIEGKPNKYKRRGRPSTAFGPRSSRVARALLMDPDRPLRQQEIAQTTGLDDGFVSRIVHRLETDHLIVRDEDDRIQPLNPNLLLDSWAEFYDFNKHTIIQGHVTASSGEKLIVRIAKALNDRKAKYALTGLAAAWVYRRFASFRLASFYIETLPDDALKQQLGFREVETGANVWLVVPNDEGVFVGAAKRHAMMCAHPLQVFLDLQSHPERAKEAAEELRAHLLRWEK